MLSKFKNLFVNDNNNNVENDGNFNEVSLEKKLWIDVHLMHKQMIEKNDDLDPFYLEIVEGFSYEAIKYIFKHYPVNDDNVFLKLKKY